MSVDITDTILGLNLGLQFSAFNSISGRRGGWVGVWGNIVGEATEDDPPNQWASFLIFFYLSQYLTNLMHKLFVLQ